MTAFPQVQAKIRDAVEAEGLSPEEVLRRLHEQAELELLGDEAPESDKIPNQIYIIAQALAYRAAAPEDLEEIFALLNESYSDEVSGKDAFREGPAVRKSEVEELLSDADLLWLVGEAPNGHGYERDGVILGVCAYTTNGISRRNGKEEGRLCSIRVCAVKRNYQGLCVGRRLLAKVEATAFGEGCCRMLVCLPSTRQLMHQWIQRRGFVPVAAIPYPFAGLGHSPLPDMEKTELVQFVLINPSHSLNRPATEARKPVVLSALADSKDPPGMSMPHQILSSRCQADEDSYEDDLGVD